jgi:glycerophosphoryl diester phosphodiesterase
VRESARWAVTEGGCAAVCVDRRFVDARLVEAVHGVAGRVFAWTVDREPEMRRLVALGVDGLITNAPARARRVRDAAAGTS